MGLGFFPLLDKVRNDPLGVGHLNTLQQNLAFLRSLAAVEHLGTGEHDAVEVPRACVSVVWGGATYTISPSSADVTAVANPAVGTVVLTLASGRFVNASSIVPITMRPQINVKASGVENKPWMSGYSVDSSTQITVYLKQLSSALGAGNAWAATDGSFDIAIHSQPLRNSAWAVNGMAARRFGQHLTEYENAGIGDWNSHLQGQGDMRLGQLVAHASSGAHNVREVAKEYAHVQYKASDTSNLLAAHSANVSGFNRARQGVSEVSFTSALTTPTQGFPSVDYQQYSAGSPTTIYVGNAKQTSSTKTTVYTYKYSTGVWAREDVDYFLVVHGG